MAAIHIFDFPSHFRAVRMTASEVVSLARRKSPAAGTAAEVDALTTHCLAVRTCTGPPTKTGDPAGSGKVFGLSFRSRRFTSPGRSRLTLLRAFLAATAWSALA